MTARCALACCLLLIAACAQQSIIESTDYQQQRAALLAYPDWQLRGKIGLKVDGKPRSAMLNWQQTNDGYAIRLSGPLGIGAVRIENSGDQVSVQQAGKPPITADSADDLLHQVTGLRAPLDNIRYWVRGLAADSKLRHLTLDPVSGLPATFEQDGWLLSFDRYKTHKEFLLPRRIVIQPATGKPSDTKEKITILVSRWTIPANAKPAN
ncbi:MAG: lipoprotein insertase outer membrane protein LolB [Pseudomonadales bacterium]